MRKLLTDLGYDGNEFGEHSSRRGAATHSSEVGVSDANIQFSGGWTNSASMQLYIDKKPKHFQKLAKQIFSEQ